VKKLVLLILLGVSTLFGDFVRDNYYSFIVDTETGLVWYDESVEKVSFINAVNRCESLSVGSYDDWFLPNFNQLLSITDDTKSNPAISTSFSSRVSQKYWSSTSVHRDTSKAWSVDFSSGKSSLSSKTSLLYYRCARFL